MLETYTTTVGVDTHAAIKALQVDDMFTEAQAEAIIERIRSVQLYGVATATQLHGVRNELKDDIQRLEEKIHGVEKELKADIQGVRNELHSFRAEIFKWGGLLVIGQYALGIGILLKLFGAL